jgi:hypothetical protein
MIPGWHRDVVRGRCFFADCARPVFVRAFTRLVMVS